MHTHRTHLLDLLAPLLGILLAGCPSLSTLHTARTTPLGKTEVGVNAALYGVRSQDGADGALPTAEFQLRYGLSETVDMGVKVYPFGVGLDANLMFEAADGVVLSVNPGVNLIRFEGNDSSLTFTYLWLPLLADVIQGKAATVTIGARVGYAIISGSGSGGSDMATGVLYGGMLGIKLRAGERFAIMPELDLIRGTGSDSATLYNAGVAFLF